MKQTKQQQAGKVVPFTGEFYPEVQPAPAANNTAAFVVMVCAALLGGLAVGAISTYQSADQVQLRQMKADALELEKLKNQVCRQ